MAKLAAWLFNIMLICEIDWETLDYILRLLPGGWPGLPQTQCFGGTRTQFEG